MTDAPAREKGKKKKKKQIKYLSRKPCGECYSSVVTAGLSQNLYVSL